MIYKKRIFCSLLVLVGLAGRAQLYSRLTSEYAHINSVFTDPGYQSFTINYYYSTEKKPAVYTDSMSASFQVHQGNYFGHFGQNTVMQNNQYLLSFYSSNSSILVSNPVHQKAAAMQGVNFDSAFLATNIDSAWITDQGSVRTIRYRFTDSSAFKNCTVSYDKNNYQLKKICYCMKQRLVSPGDTVNMPDNPCVSILYAGFSQGAFSDSIFDHSRYVVKDSTGQFRGVGIYSSYEVINTYRDGSTSFLGGGVFHQPAFSPPSTDLKTASLVSPHLLSAGYDCVCGEKRCKPFASSYWPQVRLLSNNGLKGNVHNYYIPLNS